jgi:hypothetical protein
MGEIGQGSTFDVYMDTIEMFINYSNNPNDELLNRAVLNYYTSSLLNYWVKTKNYLNNLDIESFNFNNAIYPLNNKSQIDFHIIYERDVQRLKLKYNKSNITDDDIKQFYNDIMNDNKKLNFKELNFEELKEEFYQLPEDFITETEKQHNVRYNKENSKYDNIINRVKYIKDNLKHYDKKFIEKYNLLEQNGKMNIKEITRLFIFISRLNCFQMNVFEGSYINYNNYNNNLTLEEKFFTNDNMNNLLEKLSFSESSKERVEKLSFSESSKERFKKLNDKTFLLTNNSGFFGYNTFLYAFFNGISLIGVPNKVQSFDDFKGCPIIFMNHDYWHNFSQSGGLVNLYKGDIKNIKHIYYSIINDTHLSKEEKELYILMLWIRIHEAIANDFIDYKLNIDGICKYIYGLFSDTNLKVAIQSFTKMYKSYEKLLIDDNNIDYVILFINFCISKFPNNQIYTSRKQVLNNIKIKLEKLLIDKSLIDDETLYALIFIGVYINLIHRYILPIENILNYL